MPRSSPRYSDRGLALHQLRDELDERDAAEDRAHALGDRQLELEPVREIAQHGCRREAFDDHPDRADRLLLRRATRDQLAGPPVAPRLRPAGDDQVAHPCEAGEGLRAGARRVGEATHLGEPACDERGLRVVAEPEAVGAAGGERDDVLRGGAELDADEVVVDVDAERAPR